MQSSELSVQGQTLQTLYNFYFNGYLQVNRRYQRKLVWSVDEKQKLIDSVVNKLPIPLVLIAERPRGTIGKYEIIDGLQRLEAFFSFMENAYDYNGEYFDLETIGDTKDRLDSGRIKQKRPKLSRSTSLAIANYQIPVSIYREATTSSIDEVFRRINSGGRRLSLHEIRQAGSSGPLPDLVRRVSASIRGDGTFSDIVAFSEMPKLSISRKELQYGLSIDDIFWVRHDVLAQEDVRASSDEELVLDLVLDIVLEQRPTTGWQNRDVAYGLPRKINTASLEDVNKAVANANPEMLHQQILAIIKLCDEVMAGHGSLGRHMVKLETYEKGTRRQFQAIFSALYELTFKQNMAPKSHEAVRVVLDNFWSKGLSIPTGGSAWGKQDKEKLYPQTQKSLRRAFYVREPRKNFIELNSRMYLENLLQGHSLEHPLVEMKQGFCTLSDPPIQDVTLFDDVLTTAVAMANHDRQAEGLILVGIADKPGDAERAAKFFNIKPLSINNRIAIGTEEQIEYLGYDVDRWWRRWQQKIEAAPVSNDFARSLAMSLKPVYCDGLLLWELRPKSIGSPLTYNGKFYIRIGSSTKEIPADEFLSLMTRW
ncbi:GmrSD restriction endonuclease domain-containing protein [Saccharothrix algeriensis]|uniref:GmrSD restriction endonucleases N-terminal domain-containing protein n=2 Tax=Saccharothrix algeriensis TaxID=173560 RepID=A0ABS2SDQ2_9PSEU|nr:DUF262 domain-containing protein [Saccharothrix algeriensis]MBM7814392.1 hypothetical protein [Saccharothrix algeriensis]